MIFGELPDMLKQQILEFVGTTSDTIPFRLSYSPKTKTIVYEVNRLFMKETLEYKINNPPQCKIYDNYMSVSITPPRKIQRYGLFLYPTGSTILIGSKYKKLFNAINRKYSMTMRETITEMMTLQLDNTTNIIFCEMP